MSAGDPKKPRSTVAARGVTWMSLLAATTLGVGHVDRLRAHVLSVEKLHGEDELRLIVQSYPGHTIGGAGLPREEAKPLASTQRAITAEELRNGVDVSFFQPEGAGNAEIVLVAWVEPGAPTLDLDALEARPSSGAYYGMARRSDEVVLKLSRG